MNSTPTSLARKLARAGASALLVACALWAVTAALRSSARSETLRLLAKECHPVWREFESGAFRQGDPLDKLLAAHKPAWQRTLGDVTVCEFHPAPDPAVHLSPVRVTAVRGRLVSALAGSCNGWHTFFDETQSSPNLCALAPPRQN